MPVDSVQRFSLEEIELAYNTITSKRVLNKDAPVALDRIEFPTAQMLMRKAPKSPGMPIGGGYRIQVKGVRDQQYTWWSGADPLDFRFHGTHATLQYSIGMGHFGNEYLIDYLQQHGIYVDYGSRGVRNIPGRGAAAESLINLIKETEDDCEYARALDMAKRLFSANTALPKCFYGINGLFSFTSNTTGVIGGQSQSNREYRHQLITGATADTILTDIYQMVRQIERRGGRVDMIACGDTINDLLVDVLHNTATGGGQTGSVAGKVDYVKSRFAKLDKGEMYNVAIPQNSLSYSGIPIVNEPLFELLARDEPTVGWDKVMMFIDTRHLYPIFPRRNEMINHPMPAEQRILKQSYHDEAVLICSNPQRFGVIAAA